EECVDRIPQSVALRRPPASIAMNNQAAARLSLACHMADDALDAPHHLWPLDLLPHVTVMKGRTRLGPNIPSSWPVEGVVSDLAVEQIDSEVNVVVKMVCDNPRHYANLRQQRERESTQQAFGVSRRTTGHDIADGGLRDTLRMIRAERLLQSAVDGGREVTPQNHNCDSRRTRLA